MNFDGLDISHQINSVISEDHTQTVEKVAANQDSIRGRALRLSMHAEEQRRDARTTT